MKIHIHDEQTAVAIDHPSVETLVCLFFQWKSVTTDEIDVHFVSKKRITQLHKDHFNDPTPTDCITFPIDAGDNVTPHHIGEVFICPEIAKQTGYPLADELTLYLIHTLLHLIGERDNTPDERASMRAEEEKALSSLPKIIAHSI